MKKTISGMPAYATILGTQLPEKTETYTPISHISVINRLRSEITSAGYIITGEDYRCSNNGDIAVGSFRLNYKSDPDIELAANFLNSYNKQYAFRFNLGGMVKVCMNGMMMNNNKFAAYRRVHTGSADVLAEGSIALAIKNAEEYWNTLVTHKNTLKDILLTDSAKHDILGELFFKKELLTGMQMNIVKSEIKRPSFDYKVDTDSAWALYNHITLALKETHPADWMNAQAEVHGIFQNMLFEDTVTEEELLVEIPKLELLTEAALF